MFISLTHNLNFIGFHIMAKSSNSNDRSPKEIIKALSGFKKAHKLEEEAAYHATITQSEHGTLLAFLKANATLKAAPSPSAKAPAAAAASEFLATTKAAAESKVIAKTSPDNAVSSVVNTLKKVGDIINVANQMVKEGKKEEALKFATGVSNNPDLENRDKVEIDAWLIRNSNVKMKLKSAN